MAQLDPLLKAMVDRNAEELVLSDGEKPVLRFGDSLKPVSPRVLQRNQIAGLLAELSTEIDAATLASGQAQQFTYRLGGSSPFLCEVVPGEAYTARIAPATQDRSTGDGRSALPVTAAAVAEPTPPVVEPAASTPSATVTYDSTGGPEIDRLLRRMIQMEASDLHLSADEVPMVRQHGDMQRLDDEPAFSGERLFRMLEVIMPQRSRDEYHETHDADFAYEIEGVSRFRGNVFCDRKGTGAVFRVIPTDILTAEQLGLSEAILRLCQLPKGLVLVTGPTGSGKSTTLAAMIDEINRTRRDHIITIEDPIEFVHPNKNCLINQREVGTHTSGFKKALRAALREDPDIVLVGELRDLETIAIAIETAETGHLVFGTLHTTTACSTIDRVIDQFPADRQSQIRTMLSESLRGVIAQNLLKKIGGGRVGVQEVLLVNPAIANLIREAKTFQIPSLMQTGRRLGMVLLNDAMLELVKQKVVEPDQAVAKAADKAGMVSALKKAGINVQAPAVD